MMTTVLGRDGRASEFPEATTTMITDPTDRTNLRVAEPPERNSRAGRGAGRVNASNSVIALIHPVIRSAVAALNRRGAA